MKTKDSRLRRAGVSGYNKPKRTPGHSKKSHIVVAKEGDKVKTIRFGQQGVKTAGKPKAGESQRQKNRRKSFKARHANINAKRRRIQAGSNEKMRKPGTKGAPTAKAFKRSAKTAKKRK